MSEDWLTVNRRRFLECFSAGARDATDRRGLAGLDLVIGSRQLLTNRTGHPVVSLPSGCHRGMPTAIHFTGHVLR